MPDLAVPKTYKLLIGGAFVRSESGRSREGAIAQFCLASRKDTRDAVTAARGAQAGWAGRTAYNRSQILYRAAEMLESRREEFHGLLAAEMSGSPEVDVQAAIDHFVYFAGWCDKHTAILGSVNPVADRYFGFTFPEPTGVVGLVCGQATGLAQGCALLAATLAGGNTAILLANEQAPLTACVLGEVIATSDVPGGVVNILTGDQNELLPVLAKHMDVNALVVIGTDQTSRAKVTDDASENLKRLTFLDDDAALWSGVGCRSLSLIETGLELKSVWHPVGV